MTMFLQVFVSTGEKNAMFTLRTAKFSNESNYFYSEAYIKNLSTTFETAENLAIAYADDLRNRIGCSDIVIEYVGAETDNLFRRKGKLSVFDSKAIEEIENGIFPFGKYKGTKIEDAPETYLLWLCDQLKITDLKPAFFALSTVASGIVHERGLLAKREAAKKEKLEADMKSSFFGEIGKRYEIVVNVIAKYEDRCDGFLIGYSYEMKIGDIILTHKGKTDIPVGEVNIKFTVKYQFETKNGVKKTYINRPVVM